MTTKDLTKPRIHSGDIRAKQSTSKQDDSEHAPNTKSPKQPPSNDASPLDLKPNSNGRFSPIAIQPKISDDRHPDARRPDVRCYVSEADYWGNYYHSIYGNYEWNNGYLEKKRMASVVKFRLYFWFVSLVRDYLFVNNLGSMVGLEVGFKLNLRNATTIRKPDLGVVLYSNSIPLGDEDRTYQGTFDICLESVSDSTPDEVKRDTVIKKDEYAQAGVSEYYILDDTGVETVFYHLSPAGVYIPIQPVNGIIQSTIMPGFQFRLDDLYTRPRIPTLAMDPVYSGYVSPEYRVAREQAEEAQQQAEEAQKQIEEVQQQAEEAQKQIEEAQQQAREARREAKEAQQQAEEAQQQAEEAEEARRRAEGGLRMAEIWAEQLRAAGIVPNDLDA